MFENADRREVIEIGGKKYGLLLTTKATKDITKRYGGMEQLGDKLMKGKNMDEMLNEVIWLIVLLANQEILIHNLKDKQNPKPLITEEEVELLTSPFDLAGYKDAIMAAMVKGTKRNIQSEDNGKNTEAGMKE